MQPHCADLSGMTGIDVRPGKGVLTGSSGWHLIQPGLPRDEDHMSWLQDRRQGLLIGSSIGGAGICLAILAGRKFAVLDSLAGVFARVADLDVQTIPRIVAVPRTIGILLAALLLVRLCVNATPRVRSWTRRAAGIGFASYLVWQLAVLFVLPPGNADFAVFYRAGQEAAAGRDPYLYAGEDVFLNPLPALGAFRLASMNPLAVLGTVWSVVTAVLTCALIPLANRILALGQNDDCGSPAPLTGDVAALLGAAMVNSNASIWGHRLGQLSTLTALALLLAVWARQKSRPGLAGVCLALAAIKPATTLPFLVLFLRKGDRPAWVGMVAVSLGLSLAAAAPSEWPALVRHNMQQIKSSAEPGKINDYGFQQEISSDILAFDHLFYRLGIRDRGLISLVHLAAVGALLGWLLALRDRRPFVATAALVATGAMLVLYHRIYDSVLLALPLACGASIALKATGRRRFLAIASVGLLLAVTDQPRSALSGLTRWSLQHGLAGRLVQAVALPYATWSILLALLLLFFCAFPLRGLRPELGHLEREEPDPARLSPRPPCESPVGLVS